MRKLPDHPGAPITNRQQSVAIAFNIIIFVLTSGVLLAYLGATVGYNMDEFLVHSPIGRYLFPLNDANIFREQVSHYDLQPTGIWSFLPSLPLRSYGYVGSLPALFYLPIYLIWPEPVSARFLGVCMLSLQAWAISALFGYRWWRVFLLLVLFMPYAFQHVIDFGQLSFLTSTVFIFFLLQRKWLRALQETRASELYVLAAGFLLFLGLWIRLSYLFILIPLLIGAFAMSRAVLFKPRILMLAWRDVVLLLLSFGIPANLLLTANMQNGGPYADLLGRAPRSVEQVLSHTAQLLSDHLLNLISTAKVVKRVEVDQTFATSAAFWLIFLVLIVWGILSAPRRRDELARVLGYLLLALISALIVGYAPQAWAMHHVIMIVPFLLCAFFSSWRWIRLRRMAQVVLIVLLGLNLYFYGLLSRMDTLNPRDLKNLAQFNRYINENFSATHLIIILDWGLYYPKVLYGAPDQAVIWPDNREQRQEALRIAQRMGLKPLFVCPPGWMRIFEPEFNATAEFVPVPFPTGDWSLIRLTGKIHK